MSLSHRMHKALDGSVSLQNEVKDIITKHDQTAAIELIIEGVTTFKEEIERNLATMHGELAQTLRKKANNMINDVSRICRRELGVTIACTQKKGGYKYEAKEPKPRTSGARRSGRVTMPPPVPSPETIEEVIERVVKEAPVDTLAEIIKVHGADKFMDMLKEAKKLLDTTEDS